MTWLAYFILAFTFIQFVVSLVNLLTDTHLPYTGKRPGRTVSVLIPARDEERNIGNILNDLKSQPFQNIEVIVFNDQSTDRTSEIVRAFARADSRFRLIDSDHLPAGWLGKNHACHSLAKAASGDYLLFLDSDVRVSGNLIGDAIAYAEQSDSGLVSIFPMQRIITSGEWATVPNMNYILVSLLPLVLVRKTGFPSLAAANGQFMLFKGDAYRQFYPHEMLKNNKVEDILTARFFKKQGLSVSCLLGDERISCRMYSGFSDSVNGFSKNVAEFFGGSYILTILFWLLTTFGFLAVLVFLPFRIFIVYLAMYLATRVLISLSGEQDVFKNLVWVLPLQLSMGLFIVKSLTNRFNKKYLWKGREIR
jgi:cellulose synthase/poly-beta-1,6-N-acetylglucosamine synthase-like glycosyltransferase